MTRAALRAGGYEAVFLPELGMLGASVRYRGSELLSLHGGVAAYRDGHTTGLPLLAPWANRLSRREFRVAGVEVDLRSVPVHTDGNGLPMHGTMIGPFTWEVARLEAARLVARFDYSTPELLRAFPFPHELQIDARVGERGLRVTTSVRASARLRVPVSFGWHPYFKVPGPRRSWTLALPPRRQLELDPKAIPTGREVAVRAERAPLGDRVFDDLLALGRTRTFVLRGGGRGVEVRFGAGYPYAQVFAPEGKHFAAIEPMTAPIDGLVTGTCPIVEPGGRFAATFTLAAVGG